MYNRNLGQNLNETFKNYSFRDNIPEAAIIHKNVFGIYSITFYLINSTEYVNIFETIITV